MHAPVRKLPSVVVGVVLAVLAAAPAALADNGGFTPVRPDSSNAQSITDTFWFITGFILFVFVLVDRKSVV